MLAGRDDPSDGPADGRPLRGYVLERADRRRRVRRRLPRHAAVVGRDVAIKVIRAELANRPEFIRRFEVEAHLVARLEHPHIVPLYDYWREPGSAYLVMRLLRGGTLEQRLAERRAQRGRGGPAGRAGRRGARRSRTARASCTATSSRRTCSSTATATSSSATSASRSSAGAHRSPPTRCRSARRRTPRRSSCAASPSARRPTCTVSAITLFEALTGELPFPERADAGRAAAASAQRPAAVGVAARARTSRPSVDGVLARATAKDPAERYATVDEFVAAFATRCVRHVPTPARVGAATVIGELRNPYKGLRAFQEADAATSTAASASSTGSSSDSAARLPPRGS